jgi:phenylpyruvate tautomerase PptA (4-oxalocrotonate tautomerase family)
MIRGTWGSAGATRWSSYRSRSTQAGRIAELVAERPGIRREDVLVSLVEVPKENWSFGNGEAQYA